MARRFGVTITLSSSPRLSPMRNNSSLHSRPVTGDRSRIVVVGSLNMDLVMRTPRVPLAGETLSGYQFSTLSGGKGANQAVACARLGGEVTMIGRIGDDAFGQVLRDGLLADGVDVSGVRTTQGVATGVAMILVEDNGQNRIVLAGGANDALFSDDLDEFAPVIEGARMLVVQLETPLPGVVRAVEIAHASGVKVLLNPAPVQSVPDELLAKVDILVPNESEASLLAGFEVEGVSTAYAAARLFRSRGVASVLITLGERGVAIVDDAGERHLPAERVEAVDTTAAGDTFIGGVSVGLAEGMSLDDAVRLGQRASALGVTRHGAQPSIPYRRELG